MTDTQPNFEAAQFHGAGYDEAVDGERLRGQLRRVYDFMIARHEFGNNDGWVTLREISLETGAPEASASASLRSLRNEYGLTIERKRARETNGLHLYRIYGEASKKQLKRKMRPVGDAGLWGEMMRCIYACAKAQQSNVVEKCQLDVALNRWANDMIERVAGGEYGQS